MRDIIKEECSYAVNANNNCSNVSNQDNIIPHICCEAITPNEDELSENPPSRSAKLRFAIKKTDFFDFETDIEHQFKNLIDIENFGEKL